ncbi:hypothetical protein A9Q84_20440 [Halobacteriovorax marinus]|uniref:Uncharacterized protein n=1 Tax=Halobacteriovorax marinus TaxID=97084 RepID=A0A1Y5F7L2_9BACT|nr:hypothetical protein A9Q84_20440 [Halobacteriovorax marinus]
MANHNTEESIISTLVDETYRVSGDEGSNSKLDLSTYFELKSGNRNEANDHLLEDTLVRNGVSFSLIQYSQKTSCFHFNIQEQQFSCPRNWGSFSELHREISFDRLKLMEGFNSDHFIDELFSGLVEYEYETICFCGNRESYLIFLPKGKEDVLNWLRKYCESGEVAA